MWPLLAAFLASALWVAALTVAGAYLYPMLGGEVTVAEVQLGLPASLVAAALIASMLAPLTPHRVTDSVLLNVPRAQRPTFRQRLLADGGVALFWCLTGDVLGGLVSYLVNQLPPF